MEDRKYIFFSLNHQKFAVDIENIGGVTEFEEITEIPNKPDYIEGIISLRGEIVTILNLQNIFNIEKSEPTESSRFILIQHKNSTYGLIVDEVTRVQVIGADDINPMDSLIRSLDESYYIGIANVSDELVTIIDVGMIIEKAKIVI